MGAISAITFFGTLLLLSVFIVLIASYVKQLRDIAKETRLEIKELNANIKYLKRRYNETNGDSNAP